MRQSGLLIDGAEIAAAIVNAMSNEGETAEMGARARTLFEQKYSRRAATERWERLLLEVAVLRRLYRRDHLSQVLATFALILMNMIPVIIVAILVALGLKFIPEKMINGFQIFAKFLVALITLGLAAAVVKFLLGWELIPGLDPIFMAPGDKPGEVMRAIEVIGSISCVLLGAYPMVLLLTRWFEKPLMSVGKVLNMNNIAAAGMVATLANNIPMFGMMKQMDTRGKVINCAFAVSAAFALGDHLGFAAANMNAMIFPMIVGKLIGGVTAIGVAMMLVPKEDATATKTEAEAQS